MGNDQSTTSTTTVISVPRKYDYAEGGSNNVVSPNRGTDDLLHQKQQQFSSNNKKKSDINNNESDTLSALPLFKTSSGKRNGTSGVVRKQQQQSQGKEHHLPPISPAGSPSIIRKGSQSSSFSASPQNLGDSHIVDVAPVGTDFTSNQPTRRVTSFKNLPPKRAVTEFGITVDEAALERFRQKKKNTSPFAINTFLPMLKPCPEGKTGKMTLVLDIDETMVHSSIKPRGGKSNPDTVIPITAGGQTGDVYVKYRPHLMTFLEAMKPLFEVIVFTASKSPYANELLNTIDPKGDLITDRLYREHCTAFDDDRVKDLSLLGRTLERMVILDNSPVAYLFQQRNAIPILSWFDDPNDTELLKLIPFLQELATQKTVYPLLDMYNVAAQAPISKTNSPYSAGIAP